MSKKLDHKQLGPFPIIEKVSSHAFRLGLTPAMSKLHNVFHVSLLELINKSSIPNHQQDPPPPVEIAGEDEYEVDRIVNSERRCGRVLYLVQWKGYEDRPDFQTWETPDNVANASYAVYGCPFAQKRNCELFFFQVTIFFFFRKGKTFK